MTHLAFVMFLKALVLLAGAAVFERWQAFKARRKAGGLSLRPDPRSGIYTVDDRVERLERLLKRAKRVFLVLFVPYAAFVSYVMIYG